MTPAGRTALLAFLALVLPPVVCVGLKWDELQRSWAIDPATAEGHLLYFTAPG